MPEVLFLPRRNPRWEVWTGHMYSSAEASQASGIKEIWEASEFEPFMRALRTRQSYRATAEGLLMSNSVSPTTPPAVGSSNAAAPNGFESLFGAVGKGEADLYILVPSEGESR